MNEIEKILSEYKPLIDRAIEKNIPREFKGKALERIAGKPSYAYDEATLTKAVAKPIWDLLDRGGKRWRPALAMMVVEALGKNPKNFVEIAAISEIVHNGTLMVDDVEDDSDERRGKAAIHKIYGEDIAINAGNSMYFLPLKIIMQSRLPDKTKNALYEAYAQEMINVSLGQGMDIYWHRGLKQSVSEKEYLQMCAYKTGCLARMAVKTAAIVANANASQQKALSDFSEAIGVAFQIQDDALNLTASEEYGKEIGGDISEGKITLMVIYTLKHSPDAFRLQQILKSHTKDPRLVLKAIDIVKECGAIDYAQGFARKMVESAWAKADAVLKNNEGKRKLKALADYLVERSY
ncbi:MAG: polyprenyl synthetase family protein [Candidatus Norongarragalinales archaeon]